MSVSPESLARLIEEVAAEEVMPRFRRLAERDVGTKAGGELVTSADTAAEARLAAGLGGLLPGASVVGEEASAKDPELPARLSDEGPVWVVDPVDGTGNFAAGVPIFAVMVALVRGGEILLSAIHQPTLRRTALAEAGGGAWMSGRRLRVAPPAAPADLIGTLHAGRFGTPELKARVKALRVRRGVLSTLRCAGAEYIRLANGECHFALFTKMTPWDHAPGVLIHREAGGFGRTLDGDLYDPSRSDAWGLLMAPDAATWAALHGLLMAGRE